MRVRVYVCVHTDCAGQDGAPPQLDMQALLPQMLGRDAKAMGGVPVQGGMGGLSGLGMGPASMMPSGFQVGSFGGLGGLGGLGMGGMAPSGMMLPQAGMMMGMPVGPMLPFGPVGSLGGVSGIPGPMGPLSGVCVVCVCMDRDG